MAKNRWLMPTNTENLKMIIAQGLISSPDGFSKYYSDVLELFLGYIPFFRGRIQPDILQSVVSEEDTLTECILELDIKILSGQVKAIKGGKLIDLPISSLDEENIDILLLPAPLPLSSLSKVIFKASNDKKTFEKDANLYSNVPINNIKLHHSKSDEKLFNSKAEISDTPLERIKNLNISIESKIDYKKVYSYGGLVANLFYISKNGENSHKVFLSLFDDNNSNNMDMCSSIVLAYFNQSDNNLDSSGRICEGMIDTAINYNNFKEEIIGFLEKDIKTSNIAKKLIEFDKGIDRPISEEFQEATQIFSKALLMLFLREDSESLMDYNLDVFSEEDYLIFAMFFGIRDKFSKIPKFLKEYDGLQNFISTQMANYAQEMINSNLKFKVSKRPLTIREMLKNDRFKEYFAKELKIEDCFQTIIPKSDYQVVKGKPLFSGIVMPKFEVLEEHYFKKVSKIKLIDYNKYHAKFERIK